MAGQACQGATPLPSAVSDGPRSRREANGTTSVAVPRQRIDMAEPKWAPFRTRGRSLESERSLSHSTVNLIPWASGRSVPQLIVQVCRRM